HDAEHSRVSLIPMLYFSRVLVVLFPSSGDHRALHSFPTRRSSDLGKLFSVNDRADVALLTGADVFHVGQGDLTSAQARAVLGDDVILGRSTHSRDQALAAEADGEIDYFCVGPGWQTPTKPGRRALGTQLLTEVAAEAGKPWSAIGGIAAGPRLDEIREAGAKRAVVVRAITSADDPAAAARDLKEELG